MEIINFDDWKESETFREGSGRSEKKWLEKDGKIGLFKFPKQSGNTTTYEYVSEKLASDIAKKIELPCAEIDIGTYKGRIGCMSHLVIDYPTEILMEGLDFILMLYPMYNKDTLVDEESGKKYSTDMVFTILRNLSDIHNSYPDIFIDDFVKILIFDFVIGNSDRHHSNWALVYKAEAIYNSHNFFTMPEFIPKISPLYDNGSSLCALEREEKIADIIRDKNRFNAMCSSKSKAMFFSENGKRFTHEGLLDYIFITKKYNSDFPLKVCSTLTEKVVSEILSDYSELLSTERILLISKFINVKIEMLKKYTKGI